MPPEAAATDVAREYAAQAGLASIPLIYTELGTPLAADVSLADGGVDSGDVLVAATTVHRDRRAAPTRAAAATTVPVRSTSRVVALVLGVAVGWWLFIIGMVFGAIALCGLIFEYYRGEHAH